MPPKVKFRKEDIVRAAFSLARKKGIDAVTAREVARELKVSVGPIFTWFRSMEQLKGEVYAQAKELYREYVERGLSEDIAHLGVWHQYIRFADDEPWLYKLLFLTKPAHAIGGAMEALRFSQELVRPSLMHIYNMDATTADAYFRDMWLVASSFATLIVTGDCPYTHDEIFSIGAEVSLALCKAFKEIPGLVEGDYDRDTIFANLVGRCDGKALK